MIHTLQGTMRGIVACGVLGAVVLPVLASGCGGDNGGTGPTDAAADQTSSSDGSEQDTGTGNDAKVQDSAVADSLAPADATGDTGGDATTTPDANPSDASDASSNPDGTTSDASDGSTPDAADASKQDAGEAALDGSDASDAGGVCVTGLGLLSSTDDGGVNDAGVAQKILFDFDPSGGPDAGADGGADAGLDPKFSAFNDSGSTATLGLTESDGHPCDGAVSMSVTYTAFGPADQLYYNYTSSVQNWTGYTKLHAWLKVVTTDYAGIQGVEPRVDSSNYADKLFGGFVSGATFSDGGWHETIVGLAPSGTYVPGMVNAFQFELQTVSSAPDGGPSAPPNATLLVDSIWLE